MGYIERFYGVTVKVRRDLLPPVHPRNRIGFALVGAMALLTFVVQSAYQSPNSVAASANGRERSARAQRSVRIEIQSTHSRQATSSEIRQLRSGRPRSIKVSARSLRFPIAGDGCHPIGISAQINSRTLELFLRHPDGCTLIVRYYEVTVKLARPVLVSSQITRVLIREGKFGREHMPLVTTP